VTIARLARAITVSRAYPEKMRVLVLLDEAHDDRHFIFVKSLLQSTKTVFLVGLEDNAKRCHCCSEESSFKIVNRWFSRKLKRIFLWLSEEKRGV
jgi:hypothetical protein